jgi:twitching motility protein PilT
VARPDDDLDELVSQLNLEAAPNETSSSEVVRAADAGVLTDWLSRVREANGSDLLLVAGVPPIIRAANGKLIHASRTVLDGDDIEAAVLPVVPRRLEGKYRGGEAIDLAFKLPNLGRFRMNLHRERGRPASAIRALPLRIPRLAELRFSHDISVLARLSRGLVLIGGPTGSGKTTTLAALVADINAREQRHIITVEDPIEYEHVHDRSVIEQVEIGVDAPDFPTSLRSVLRQAPEVIVVGELRDPETMRMAVSAAETGHLVFATVHTTDIAAALSRIVDAFPNERQNGIRQELAMALAAVLTQMLVPSVDGTRIPIAELLMASYGARQHVRKNALQHLHQEITITRHLGSFTLEESLARHAQHGRLDRADARLRAAHPEEFDSIVARQ